MKTIEVKLSLDETNLILEALGQLPFVRVYELIAKLQDQASAQLKPKVAADAPVLEKAPSIAS